MREPKDWNCDLFLVCRLEREDLAKQVAALIGGQASRRQVSNSLATIWVNDNGYYPPEPGEPPQLLTQAPIYLEISPRPSADWQAYLNCIRCLVNNLTALGYPMVADCDFSSMLAGVEPLNLRTQAEWVA